MTGQTSWGTTIFFEVSRAAPDEEPDWVDLSERIMSVGMPLETEEGRQTELVDVEPSRLMAQLRNRDDWLTPGNVLSPYYPWWKQKRRCRIRQIVGYLGFDEFDGFLEIPENQATTQVPGDTDSDVTLLVSATDLMGRYQAGRKLVSTLGEHIMYVGRVTGTLRHYYVFDEAGPPILCRISSQALYENGFSDGRPSPRSSAHVAYRAAPVASADDAPSVDLRPEYLGAFSERGTQFSQPVGSPTDPMADTDVATVTLWINADVFQQASGNLVAIDGVAALYWFNFQLVVDFNVGGRFGSIAVPLPKTGGATMVTVRTRRSPELAELISDSTRYSATLMGSSSGLPMAIGRVHGLGYLGFDGRISHLQVYAGPEDDFGLPELEDQLQMGRYGLELQRTGERVHTILDYAGLPRGRRSIDSGVSVMSNSGLAGKTVQQALDEARDTEQGRLFARGGRVVFHDRRRIHDV